MQLEEGKFYKLTCARKGTFAGKVIKVGDEWTEVEITDGEASFIASDNAVAGEVVTCRNSFITAAVEIK